MLKTKSVYEANVPEDGIRILVMRKWPRGVSKDKVDRWIKELGPSTELLNDWTEHRINWIEYEKRYRREMEDTEKRQSIKKIAELSEKKVVSLLCWEKSDEYCHRKLLKELIEKL
ncbi:MAG: DUF488 family protein [bacterium]